MVSEANTPGTFDARGCLTAAALALIAAAPPGRAPSELAAHLAGCARCQRRMLGAGAEEGRARRRRPPPVWRTAVVAAAGFLLVLMALVMARVFSSPPP
ncbi:MAG TPA: hypothetical protein VMR21_15490 [Vicinamibacteria bacterium]|nr:hypothetical protein [Vicinamibacteria bacterium]